MPAVPPPPSQKKEMATNHSNFCWIALPRHARRLVMIVSECTAGYAYVAWRKAVDTANFIHEVPMYDDDLSEEESADRDLVHRAADAATKELIAIKDPMDRARLVLHEMEVRLRTTTTRTRNPRPLCRGWSLGASVQPKTGRRLACSACCTAQAQTSRRQSATPSEPTSGARGGTPKAQGRCNRRDSMLFLADEKKNPVAAGVGNVLTGAATCLRANTAPCI